MVTVQKEWYFGIGLGIRYIDDTWIIILPFVMILIGED